MRKFCLVLPIAALLFLCSCIPLTTTKTLTTTAVAQIPIQVSADELDTAYNNNAVAADMQYKGKLLDVTGGVALISSDSIQLNVSNFLDSIFCHLSNPNLNQLASLSKGQVVTMEGICTGSNLFGVDMNKCIIITATTSLTTTIIKPTIVISSVELIASYAANSVAADQKYKGKVLQVSGPVEYIQTNVLMVRGTNSLDDVFFTFSAQNVAQLASLSRDQLVSIIGTCNGANSAGAVTFDNCSIVSSN